MIELSIALSPQISHGLMWALNTYRLCGRDQRTKIKIAAFWHKILVEIYGLRCI